MSKERPEILVYITDNKERIISGDPLTLYIADKAERQQCILALAKALRANTLELKNGDHVLISDT